MHSGVVDTEIVGPVDSSGVSSLCFTQVLAPGRVKLSGALSAAVIWAVGGSGESSWNRQACFQTRPLPCIRQLLSYLSEV